MARTKQKTEGIKLVDERGRLINPKQVRATIEGGDIFVSWNVEDLPPQHAEVEVLVKGKVSGFLLKDLAQGKGKPDWAAYAKVKVDVGRGFKVLPPPPLPDSLPFDGTKAEATTVARIDGSSRRKARGRT